MVAKSLSKSFKNRCLRAFLKLAQIHLCLMSYANNSTMHGVKNRKSIETRDKNELTLKEKNVRVLKNVVLLN